MRAHHPTTAQTETQSLQAERNLPMTNRLAALLMALFILVAGAVALADDPVDSSDPCGYFCQASQVQHQLAIAQQDLCGYFCETGPTQAHIALAQQPVSDPCGYFCQASQAQLQIALEQLGPESIQLVDAGFAIDVVTNR
ncbi:MAG: hypothetical protein JSV66_15810 [Trueperaceae bacterium]|nr:MAG: hypothetical protein JSV66_15810 [Trueperaceae bacterium]